MAARYNKGDGPMAKQKAETNGTKERASVGRERRLALALRAVLDTVGVEDGSIPEISEAETLLTDLGYGALVGIPKRVAALEAELKDAVTEQNYARVAELGKELEKVKLGRASSVAPAAE